MKKLFCLSLLALFALVGCQPEESIPAFSDYESEMSFVLPQEGGEEVISFTAGYPWTASIETTEGTEWISLDADFGPAGKTTIKVIVEPSMSSEEHSALVRIKCNGEEIWAQVKQALNVDEAQKKNLHLDLLLEVQGTATISSYMASVKDPENYEGLVDVVNKGTETSGKMRYSAIQHGKYYYGITQAKDGLAKYQIVDNQVKLIGEVPFKDNIFSINMFGETRAHEWLDDKTLIYMAYNGVKKMHIWTKFDVEAMTVIDEGEFELTLDGISGFGSAGILKYRAKDDKLFLFNTATTMVEDDAVAAGLAVVALNPKTMEVENASLAVHVDGLTNTRDGESLEPRSFVDASGDIYLVCKQKDGVAPFGVVQSVIARVKSGSVEADADYAVGVDGGHIMIMKPLRNNKALLYIRDANKSGTMGMWFFFNSYYAIYDMTTKTATPVQYDGKDLPWSSTFFADLTCQYGDKMYFGINADSGETFGDFNNSYYQAEVYVYDMKTDEVSKGFSVDARFNFIRLNAVQN